jgi:hypothetical protein
VTATVTAKKIRYHNRDTSTFAWEYADNLPDYALEQDGVKKQLGRLRLDTADDAPKINDYSADIQQWRDELRTAVADKRAARDPRSHQEADYRIDQYVRAIDLYTAAEMIPAVATQFGSYRADFTFRVHPALDEYQDMSPRRYGNSHRYVTADPVEIAFLRMHAGEYEFEEVPVGHIYSRGDGKRDGLWVPLEFYEQQRATGQAV